MEETIVIRQGTIDDVELAVKFRWLTFGDSGKEEAIEHIRKEVTRRYTEEYRNDRIVHFFAYNQKGEAVACVGAILKDDFPYYLFKPGYYGWIIDVYTDPEYRGQKIATKLLEKTHEWILSKGAFESKLIAIGSEARELYGKIGYRPTWEMSLNLKPEVFKTYNEMIDKKII